MKLVKTIKEIREIVSEWKKEGFTIGFVPTIGYLHEGHQSLIKNALENDKVIVSIFVNPIQFGPGEDFATYPRDIDRDMEKCSEAGADLIFAPLPEEMYLNDFSTFVNMTGPTDDLCGKQGLVILKAYVQLSINFSILLLRIKLILVKRMLSSLP